MKSAATSRPRRTQRDPEAEPRVSRLHRPAEMSLEAWQRQLLKQFGSEQPFLIENIGEHPIFSDFRVTNPTSGSVYRVAIRGAAPGRNFCSCFDFRTNSLGPCKHIEFTLKTLLAGRGAKRAFLAEYEPPYSSVSVEYGPQRHVCFRAGRDCPDPLRRLASRYFDKAGRLKPVGFDRFDRFVAEAKEIDPELRLYDDVLPFVAEVRDARRRAEIIDKAFPDGIRGRRFDHLIGTRLYDYQKEGTLFAARAGRSLIGDEMGLGKTIQAIAAAEIMARHLDVERVLIVCPTSLKHQWEREIANFSKRSARVIHGLRPGRAEAYRADDFFKITNFFVPMTREQLLHHEENREIVARIAAKWKKYRHLSERDQRRLMIALQRMRMSCDSSYLLDERSDHGTKAGEIMTLLGEIL